jgi:hypothetical protein
MGMGPHPSAKPGPRVKTVQRRTRASRRREQRGCVRSRSACRGTDRGVSFTRLASLWGRGVYRRLLPAVMAAAIGGTLPVACGGNASTATQMDATTDSPGQGDAFDDDSASTGDAAPSSDVTMTPDDGADGGDAGDGGEACQGTAPNCYGTDSTKCCLPDPIQASCKGGMWVCAFPPNNPSGGPPPPGCNGTSCLTQDGGVD